MSSSATHPATRSAPSVSTARCSGAGGLAPGDYTIAVVGEGLAWQQIAVRCEAGRDCEVRVDLSLGRAVRLRFRRTDGAPFGDSFEWRVFDQAGAVLAERARPLPEAVSVEIRCCLAPGEWTIEATATDGARGTTMIDLESSESSLEFDVVLDR